MSENNDVKNNTQDKRLLLIGIVLIGLLLHGCNQKPKVYHVGILSGLDFFADTADGFKAKMAELGYIEGKNIVYNMRKTNFEPAKEERILKQFVEDKVDLILTFPTEVSLMAKKAAKGTGIPVVFTQAFTEGVDLIESVRRPGGNITGVRYPGPDIAARSLELMLESAPHVKRIWIPYQRGYPSVASQLEALRSAAASLGVKLVEVPANTPADVQADLDARAKSADIGMDAIQIIHDPLAGSPVCAAIIAKFAAEHRVPIGGAADEGIITLFIDNVQAGRQAAPLADKILKGASAGTIPVVSADSSLRINYKAAKKLGIKVSEGLLSQASEIIR